MSFEKDFINEQTDFFNYMVDNNLFKNRQTYHDYITRLRYISHFYKLDGTLTFDKISDIANELKQTISERDRYNTLKGVSDIVSGLKRFAEYINSDYKKKIEDSILSENSHINNDRSLDTTEKEAIIKFITKERWSFDTNQELGKAYFVKNSLNIGKDVPSQNVKITLS